MDLHYPPSAGPRPRFARRPAPSPARLRGAPERHFGAAAARGEGEITWFTRALFVLLFVLGIAFAPEGASAAGGLQFPPLTGRVVDNAHLLDAATTASIDAKLAALEQKTGDQLVVVTLPTLQGLEIEDYGYQLGRAWGIGQKGKNNGALLIIAPNEHRARIEVGYGLEGTLTDAISRLIIENSILPRFRANDYAGGISRGVDDIIQVLGGDSADFQRRAAEQTNPQPNITDYAQLIWVLIFIGLWLFLAFRPRRRTHGGGMPWIIPMGGGWSSPGWGGGGFSGGGFSGGGGSFGGGGASGRW
ncbi:MAG: YgcG family protein [Alphaproteobacteria bacterium]|nr:YgcG family protein [Alphaproteobacteria bacterium]